jgi:glycosyltransferase involved in cell wall biosynthesis
MKSLWLRQEREVSKRGRRETCISIKIDVGVSMDYSVVICTRNRAGQLAQMLEVFKNLHIPSGVQWEMVVVDNGSTDDTAQVIESFSTTLPMRRVFEPKAGLSNARNAAVDAVKGLYILWTDDDVIVDPEWLSAYHRASKTWPDAAVFGGKVVCDFEEPSPIWFKKSAEHLGDLLAARDFGDKPLPLAKYGDPTPYGANYAIKTKEQRQHLYDPSLGVAPNRRWGGEETAVISAMLRDGAEGWWVPDAIVHHQIPTSRQTIEYIFQYYEACGELRAHNALSKGQENNKRYVVRACFVFACAFVRFAIMYTLNQKAWVKALSIVALHLGRIKHGLAQYVNALKENRRS